MTTRFIRLAAKFVFNINVLDAEMNCFLPHKIEDLHRLPADHPVKICDDNEWLIEAALDEVAGPTYAHTIATYEEIISIVAAAERKLKDLGLPSRLWYRARYLYQSGRISSRDGRQTLSTTAVLIERRLKAWYIIRLARVALQPSEVPEEALIMTTGQRVAVLSILDQRTGLAIVSPQALRKQQPETHHMLRDYGMHYGLTEEI